MLQKGCISLTIFSLMLWLLAPTVPAVQAQELTKEYFEHHHGPILFYKWDNPKITDIGLTPEQAKFLLDDDKDMGYDFMDIQNEDIFYIARFKENVYLTMFFLEQYGGCGTLSCSVSVYKFEDGKLKAIRPSDIHSDCNSLRADGTRDCFIVHPLFPDRD